MPSIDVNSLSCPLNQYHFIEFICPVFTCKAIWNLDCWLPFDHEIDTLEQTSAY